MAKLLICIVSLVVCVYGQDKCPNGSKIYATGVNAAQQKEIEDIHNQFRKLIEEGKVPNQPRGTNLKPIKYDVQLAGEVAKVLRECKNGHVDVFDDRFPALGQNIHTVIVDKNDYPVNWTSAVTDWFNEHEFFKYPEESIDGKVTGHYKQVVWGTTYTIGCDYICFDSSGYYYHQYTCNYYAPAYKGAPYELAKK